MLVQLGCGFGVAGRMTSLPTGGSPRNSVVSRRHLLPRNRIGILPGQRPLLHPGRVPDRVLLCPQDLEKDRNRKNREENRNEIGKNPMPGLSGGRLVRREPLPRISQRNMILLLHGDHGIRAPRM